jgi:serine/threonine protein kinase
MFWTFQDDFHVYFVLEHTKGGDLLSVVHRFHSDGMSEAHARFYIAEILLALEYLHEMNVVVCDLKPVNCLTTAAGHVVLTGFLHSKRLLSPGDPQRKVKSSLPKVEVDQEMVLAATPLIAREPQSILQLKHFRIRIQTRWWITGA